MATPNWFVSHTHLDHIAALPVYVARRRMMKMEPPTIYLPAEAVEGVEALLRAFQRLDRGRMPVEARRPRARPGDRALARAGRPHVRDQAHDPVARLPRLGAAQEAQARVPAPHRATRSATCGSRASRSRPRSGCPRSPTWATPSPQGLDALPDLYRAEILIMEMTFVAPGERPEKIHKFGHTHLDDIIARADRFENEVIIASHFSTRLHPDQIQRIVEKTAARVAQGPAQDLALNGMHPTACKHLDGPRVVGSTMLGIPQGPAQESDWPGRFVSSSAVEQPTGRHPIERTEHRQQRLGAGSPTKRYPRRSPRDQRPRGRARSSRRSEGRACHAPRPRRLFGRCRRP